MDLFCPFNGVLIWAGAEIWEEAELEVIMGVDEAGEEKIAG